MFPRPSRFIGMIAAAIFLSAIGTGGASAQSKPAPMSAQDKSDLAAVTQFAKVGQPTELDMSNLAHYRFFTRQMQSAGFTKERYPQLHKVTDKARTLKSPAIDRRPVALKASDVAIGDNPNVSPIQTMTSIGTSDGVNYVASALSSVPQTPYFSSLVVQLYDVSGNPIGQPASTTSNTQPASNLNTIATGTLPVAKAVAGGATTPAAVQGVATYFWQDQYGKAYHGVVQGIVTSAPSSITNLAPMPGPGQLITKLCLGRTGTDCTYTPAGGSGTNVMMPVQGSISFNSPISTTAITNTSLITMARPDTGQGGGCTVATTSNFFADPNTVINGNTITWNLAPAQFQPVQGCLTANSTAIYTFTLGLTVNNQQTFVTITSDPNTDPQDPYFKLIPQLQVFFSCLAEGTLVTLADGSTVPIENLKEGQSVRVDASGRTMLVDSKLKGKEDVPMVRLRTAGKRDVLITDGHPVMTTRGPVLAGLLRVGQRVITEKGPDKIISVKREMFNKPVWNLNVGTPPADMNHPRVKGATFFAGGVQVGDNIMQFVENRRNQQATAALAVRRTPPEWRRDVQSAIQDAKTKSGK